MSEYLVLKITTGHTGIPATKHLITIVRFLLFAVFGVKKFYDALGIEDFYSANAFASVFINESQVRGNVYTIIQYVCCEISLLTALFAKTQTAHAL